MTRADRIQADHGPALRTQAKRFGDHEDMNVGHVLGWLAQFSDDDLALGIKVLETITYYNATNIRKMTEEMANLAFDALKKSKLKRAAFVPVGKFGSGSGTVARVLRESLAKTKHELVDRLDLATSKSGDWDAVVFIEDFSGTGKVLSDWWLDVESIVRPLGVPVLVGLLVVSPEAHSVIEVFAEVLAVEELEDSANVLSGANSDLSAKQKERIRHYCEKSGASETFREGFGGCGLLLAFKHGCPDNSLPILWHEHKKWSRLFRRSAI